MADDYMSDTFLEEAASVRPGLVRGVGKRKLEAHKQHVITVREAKEEAKARKNSAKDQLLKGMQTTVISEDNPGFKMMKMMGYKEGSGLGKEGDGRAEPITVDPFKDRSGLGKGSEQKERVAKKLKLEQDRLESYKRNEAVLLRQYRLNKSNEAVARQALSSVRKCQVICRQMDEQLDIVPSETWFWPNVLDEDDEDYYEPDPQEILPHLSRYLRTTHYYCLWCGVKYSNDTDLTKNCPGELQSHHDDSQHDDFGDDTDFADS